LFFQPPEGVFRLCILGVDKSYRGHHIGHTLMKESTDLGRSLGYKLAKGESTSHYSYHMHLGQGWRCVHQIAYKDFKDGDGNVIYNVLPPHTHFRLMVKDM
jgi:GNAT superfamily N-acetyltransferase